MQIGVNIARGLMALGCLILVVVSARAIGATGAGGAGPAFFAAFGQPWPAQFATDLTLHLLLAAAWMIYRTKSLAIGVVSAILAINFGAVFTLAYTVVVSVRAGGDFRKVLLGDRFATVG